MLQNFKTFNLWNLKYKDVCKITIRPRKGIYNILGVWRDNNTLYINLIGIEGECKIAAFILN